MAIVSRYLWILFNIILILITLIYSSSLLFILDLESHLKLRRAYLWQCLGRAICSVVNRVIYMFLTL